MIDHRLKQQAEDNEYFYDKITYSKIFSHSRFSKLNHKKLRNFRNEKIFNEENNRYTHGEDWHQPIDGLKYLVNSEGWHGTEFVREPYLLCAGCSVTSGVGLSHEETWPHILANWLDVSVNVVAMPGASVSQIVYLVFHHVERFGWPKRISLCLPDIHRSFSNATKPAGVDEVSIWYNHETAEFHDHAPNIPKFRSFKVDSVDGTTRKPPLNIVVRENMMALDMLSSACSSLGIDMSVSTHSVVTHKILSGGEIQYPGYVRFLPYLKTNIFDQVGRIEIGDPEFCCDLRSESERWTFAADGCHPGIHSHIHIAEAHAGEKIR